MLLYHRPIPAKIPKRRSRAGCIHCKEKKKKCNEDRPQCDRCMERGLRCEYEPVKPRKRRRTVAAVESSQSRSHVTSDPGPGNGFPSGFLTTPRHSSSSASPIVDGWDSGLSTAESSTSSCGDGLDDNTLPPLGPYEGHIPTCSAEEIFSQVLSRSKSSYAEPPTLAPALKGSPHHQSAFRASPTSFLDFTTSPSRQTLLAHFSGVLCHLLVFREEPSNPFVDLVLPMAQHSQAVLHAILALSSAHMEHQGIENAEKSLDLHSKAIQGLTQLIAERDKANRDEVLAVIMLLVYYEVVRGGSSTILNGHLKGALSIMKARRSDHAPTGQFLEKAFRYFDVICALSFGTPPISGSLAPLPVAGLPASSSPGNVLAGVDNLFGFVADLWPVVHRLGTLLDLKRQIENESSINLESASGMQKDFENTTSTLELALHQWIPKLPGSMLALETSAEDQKLQSILNSAEAYRQASLVYLFRTVLGYPRMSSKVQAHAKQALQACLRVVVFAGPLSALLWPLFVASCEAVDEMDQSVSRTVYKCLEQRQNMQNIVFAWDVAEDIWRRREHDRELDWRDVTDERGGSIVFG